MARDGEKRVEEEYALLRNGLSTAGGIAYFCRKPSVRTRLNSCARLARPNSRRASANAPCRQRTWSFRLDSCSGSVSGGSVNRKSRSICTSSPYRRTLAAARSTHLPGA